MPAGLCPGCKQQKPLLDGHFIPDAIYGLLGNEEFAPVRITPKGMFPTTNQVHHHLLCNDCEQRLSYVGENWTIPLLSRIDGAFLLRDRLLTRPPIVKYGDGAIFAGAENPEIDVPKLMNFAIGIYFKAAVHSWQKDVTEPWIILEPTDIEALRLFMQGEASLPSHIALEVMVDSSPIVLPTVRMPWRGTDNRLTNYCLYVPGVLFNLYVGPNAQKILKETCINGSPSAPIMSAPIAKLMREVFREDAKEPYKSEKLLKTTAEIEARGLSIKLGD
jgi:hypothetical protein